MKVPKGKTCYFRGKKYRAGAEVPKEAEGLLETKKPVGRPAGSSVNSGGNAES